MRPDPHDSPATREDSPAAPIPSPSETHDGLDTFHRVAFLAAQAVGSPWAFISALLIIVFWAATGPLFGFGDTWQLVINTSTTIITFLMVFLIQSSQNRDARALHLKLNELIRTSRARNVFADLEEASEQELDAFHEEFRKLHKCGVDPNEAVHRASKHVRHKNKHH
jgi:low affinity Fe/Cu permease